MSYFIKGVQMMGGAVVVCVLLALTMLVVVVIIKWMATLDYKKNRKDGE